MVIWSIFGGPSTPKARSSTCWSNPSEQAAVKLMRKLLRKYAFVPERLVTDDLRSYSAAVHVLGIEHCHERGRWKNNRAENSRQPTRRRERKMQRFKSRVRPRNSCQRTPPSTTSSTSSVISPQPKRTARFALWRWTHGGPPSQQPEDSWVADASRSPNGNVTIPLQEVGSNRGDFRRLRTARPLPPER